jgi:hypothetical protein
VLSDFQKSLRHELFVDRAARAASGYQRGATAGKPGFKGSNNLIIEAFCLKVELHVSGHLDPGVQSIEGLQPGNLIARLKTEEIDVLDDPSIVGGQYGVVLSIRPRVYNSHPAVPDLT